MSLTARIEDLPLRIGVHRGEYYLFRTHLTDEIPATFQTDTRPEALYWLHGVADSE